MESGELTARRLAELYLARIEAVDKGGPYRQLDDRVEPRCRWRSPIRWMQNAMPGRPAARLHGIPILIKDNIDTHDRMQTTAGSLALEGNIAKRMRLSSSSCAKQARLSWERPT
jgi:amidase